MPFSLLEAGGNVCVPDLRVPPMDVVNMDRIDEELLRLGTASTFVWLV